MPEHDVTYVETSVEFRDAVMTLEKGNCPVYVRKAHFSEPAFRVIPSASRIDLHDLWDHPKPPVHMEDFAQAMVRHQKNQKSENPDSPETGRVMPGFVVFTL